MTWSPTTWQSRVAQQQASYGDPAALARVVEEIGHLPPLVTSWEVEKLRSHRVTLLPGVLMAALRTVIEAVGSDKADAVRNVLKGPEDPHKYPCQIAARNSDTATWFLDKAAASEL